LAALEKFDTNSILEAIRQTGKELKIKGRALYFPLRLAITMKEEGIEIHEFIYFIGKDQTLTRIDKVLGMLNA